MSKILVLNAGSSSLKYALFEARKSTVKGVLSFLSPFILTHLDQDKPIPKI